MQTPGYSNHYFGMQPRVLPKCPCELGVGDAMPNRRLIQVGMGRKCMDHVMCTITFLMLNQYTTNCTPEMYWACIWVCADAFDGHCHMKLGRTSEETASTNLVPSTELRCRRDEPLIQFSFVRLVDDCCRGTLLSSPRYGTACSKTKNVGKMQIDATTSVGIFA